MPTINELGFGATYRIEADGDTGGGIKQSLIDGGITNVDEIITGFEDNEGPTLAAVRINFGTGQIGVAAMGPDRQSANGLGTITDALIFDLSDRPAGESYQLEFELELEGRIETDGSNLLFFAARTVTETTPSDSLSVQATYNGPGPVDPVTGARFNAFADGDWEVVSSTLFRGELTVFGGGLTGVTIDYRVGPLAQADYLNSVSLSLKTDLPFTSLSGELFENVFRGGAGVDVLNGGAADDLIRGGEDGDILNGRTGRDDVRGEDGDDVVKVKTTFALNDHRISGGEGEDVLENVSAGVNIKLSNFNNDADDDGVADANAGVGSVVGGFEAIDGQGAAVFGDGRANYFDFSGVEARDVAAVRTQAGADIVMGFETSVEYNLGGGADFFQGVGAVSDEVAGGTGRDDLRGGGGRDILGGGAGNDSLRGEAGSDELNGGGGVDSLRGGTGLDTLIGGRGADMLFGGAGPDTFVYLTVADSTASRTDVIRDFSGAGGDGDRIDVSALSASAAYSTAADFSGAQGEFISQVQAGVTTVLGDTDGDRTADFTLELSGAHALSSDDFVLS